MFWSSLKLLKHRKPNNTNGKPHRHLQKLSSKFSLILGLLNRVLIEQPGRGAPLLGLAKAIHCSSQYMSIPKGVMVGSESKAFTPLLTSLKVVLPD